MASRLRVIKPSFAEPAEDTGATAETTKETKGQEQAFSRYEKRKKRGRENNISVRLFDSTADRSLKESIHTCRRIIRDSPHDYETISLITGLSVPTISKMALGKVKSPHLRTVQRIKAFGGYRMVDTLFRK